jgi:hypothetical protein
MILAGIALGIYVGLWVCFIGGIVDIINQVKATDTDALTVAWGIAKIVLAGFAGGGIRVGALRAWSRNAQRLTPTPAAPRA